MTSEFAAAEINSHLDALLESHNDVPGVSIAILGEQGVSSFARGFARNSTAELMTDRHMLECASLSKTVASAFAIQLFQDRNIPLTTPVNEILETIQSPFRLQVAQDSGAPAAWASQVTLQSLMNHTSLPMPYVSSER